ncbi:MAG: filamentous hemagglutinin N-terminal domain-containing protein, partial [Pleurocapsa sp.]
MVNWQWKSSVILVIVFLFLYDSAIAQVIPDNTLGDESSVVNSRDETSDLINGGAIRGQNLFHSFQEFNVNQGRGVYFTNPEAITNIFSRVTGSNASNILGTLGVLKDTASHIDGAANLFLINPNGIIFGEDASLDLEGSFAATTADRIAFGDRGSFDALNPQIPQLLTIDPSAFFYSQLNEGITNNSANLSVPDGKSLILLGGNVAIAGGSLNAVGGSIKLGGLKESGRVAIEFDRDILNLSFPESIAKGNVNLDDSSLVTEGGDIEIIATNISLDNTELITTANTGNAGDIQFTADNAVKLFDSEIISRMEQGSGGNAGSIFIQGNSLLAADTTFRSSSQSSNGDGGDITLAIAESTIINRGFGLISDINQGSAGEAGDININSGSLSVLDAAISAETNTGGTAGNIVIQVDDTVSLVAAEISSSNLSGTLAGVIAGNTTINAGSLFLSDDTEILASYNGRDLGDCI